MPRLILSPVGTSLLRAAADGDQIDFLSSGANIAPTDPPSDHAALARTLKEHALHHAETASVEALREASAELNALFGIEMRSDDMHLLAATDTLYGHTAADTIATILRNRGTSVDILKPSGLTTETPEAFGLGVKTLFKQCGDQIPAYREQGYEIVFNLTGGFKSLQGYLNTVGMLYADRMVYIFERSTEIIEIPRLPLQMAPDADLATYRRELLLLNAGYPLPPKAVQGLSEVFYDVIDGESFLTEWGTALWGAHKLDLLSGWFPDLPHITYTRPVRKDIERRARPADHMRILERLAACAAQWEREPGEAALRNNMDLQANRLKNKTTEAGDPLFRTRFGEDRLAFSLADDGLVLWRYLPRGEIYDAV